MPEPTTSNFPPQAALDWFKAKGIQPGFDYQDVWKEEHSNAFTVAKMLDADLLVEVRQLVEDALEGGQTFAQFKAVLEPLLVKSGWWGIQTMDDPATGETKQVQLGSEGRVRTIYNTNMRTARAAGQWQRIERTKRAMPYPLPLPTVPEMLTRIAVVIAFYWLADRDNMATNLLEERYKKALADLKEIASGAMELGLPATEVIPEGSQGKVELLQENERLFTRNTLKGVL